MARDSDEEATCDLSPHPCAPYRMTGSVGPTCPFSRLISHLRATLLDNIWFQVSKEKNSNISIMTELCN